MREICLFFFGGRFVFKWRQMINLRYLIVGILNNESWFWSGCAQYFCTGEVLIYASNQMTPHLTMNHSNLFHFLFSVLNFNIIQQLCMLAIAFMGFAVSALDFILDSFIRIYVISLLRFFNIIKQWTNQKSYRPTQIRFVKNTAYLTSCKFKTILHSFIAWR